MEWDNIWYRKQIALKNSSFHRHVFYDSYFQDVKFTECNRHQLYPSLSVWDRMSHFEFEWHESSIFRREKIKSTCYVIMIEMISGEGQHKVSFSHPSILFQSWQLLNAFKKVERIPFIDWTWKLSIEQHFMMDEQCIHLSLSVHVCVNCIMRYVPWLDLWTRQTRSLQPPECWSFLPVVRDRKKRDHSSACCQTGWLRRNPVSLVL